MKISSSIKKVTSNSLVRNSLVWATVMIGSAFALGEDYQKINFILMMGFFLELLRHSSARNATQKADSSKNSD